MDLTPCDSLADLLDGSDDADRHQRATALLDHLFGAARLAVTPPELLATTGLVSPAEARRIAAAFRLALASLRCEPAAPLVNPALVARSVPELCTRPTEEVWIVSVDVGLRPLSRDMVARAGPSFCAVNAADALRPALLAGATGLFVLHNHPSGVPTPSDADLRFTQRLRRLTEIAGLILHDHVVVAGLRWASCVSQDSGQLRGCENGHPVALGPDPPHSTPPRLAPVLRTPADQARCPTRRSSAAP